MIAPRIALNKKLNFPQKFAQNHKVSAKSLPKMEVSQYAGWRGLSIPTAAHVDGGATGRRCCRIFAGFDIVIEKW